MMITCIVSQKSVKGQKRGINDDDKKDSKRKRKVGAGILDTEQNNKLILSCTDLFLELILILLYSYYVKLSLVVICQSKEAAGGRMRSFEN